MLERFTKNARAVVVQAREEAIRLGHRYIGTEHLLLALLKPEGGTAYTVLSGAGLDRDRVRTEVRRMVGGGEAVLGVAALGDEDAEALQAIGIDLPAVRAKIEEVFGPGALDFPGVPARRGLLHRRGKQPGRVPFTARAKKVLELAVREAVRRGQRYIGTEHLLLGLLREGHGLASVLITEAGLSLDDLRARTLAVLDEAA
ncbi:MAG: Clp protease [Actinobacteria bacterium]|nr:MAG: Clp protease [Actinomycetota bacterium]